MCIDGARGWRTAPTPRSVASMRGHDRVVCSMATHWMAWSCLVRRDANPSFVSREHVDLLLATADSLAGPSAGIRRYLAILEVAILQLERFPTRGRERPCDRSAARIAVPVSACNK